MAVLSAVQVAQICHNIGLGQNAASTAVAIAYAESGLNTNAVGHNPPTQGCPNGSRDRGLWQINDCYHREVSDGCAFDATCNAAQMARISGGGTNWTPWSTFNSGAYRRFLGAAQSAVAIAYGSTGAGVGTVGGTSGKPQGYDPIGHAASIVRSGGSPVDAIGTALRDIANQIASQI